MITIKTTVNISDNSGGRKGECIKVLKSKYQHAKLGDSIVIAVKSALIDRKVKRHDVKIGAIVRIRKQTKRNIGTHISFGDNAIVIIDPRKNPTASRLFGPVAQELRYRRFAKILSLAASII